MAQSVNSIDNARNGGMQSKLTCKQLSFSYNQSPNKILNEINLDVGDHSFVSIIGPSGCGKSTLLKLVAGLEMPTEGSITVSGEPVTKPSPSRAMVFQSPALFPWRTVEQNVEIGLKFSGVTAAERREISSTYIKLVGLEGYSKYFPHQLSGGMQQRVGIARALAVKPDIILMDEPFSALDAITRGEMQDELLTIWEKEHRTVLFVTHSIDEALILSDRIIVLKNGCMDDDIAVPFERPRTREQMESIKLYKEIYQTIFKKLYRI
jgi:ABC-type nitrate/sulfonate/bicarbonate transport system ATPase subunit